MVPACRSSLDQWSDMPSVRRTSDFSSILSILSRSLGKKVLTQASQACAQAERVPQSMNGDGWGCMAVLSCNFLEGICGIIIIWGRALVAGKRHRGPRVVVVLWARLWATDCCGRGHGGEVGTTGRCGCGGGCCLLSAACLPTGARNACPNRCLCLGRRTIRRRAPHWPFGAAIDLEIFRYPLCIRPQPLRCRSWGSAIMRANSGPPPRRPRLQGGALQEHHPWPRWSLQPDKLWIDLLLFHWPQAGYKAFCAEWS